MGSFMTFTLGADSPSTGSATTLEPAVIMGLLAFQHVDAFAGVHQEHEFPGITPSMWRDRGRSTRWIFTQATIARHEAQIRTRYGGDLNPQSD